ncbi:MAG: hypothetical protein J6K55_08780 [Clostridia bacterium]|nr:hypothetical protein [Clostridia bacterium]
MKKVICFLFVLLLTISNFAMATNLPFESKITMGSKYLPERGQRVSVKITLNSNVDYDLFISFLDSKSKDISSKTQNLTLKAKSKLSKSFVYTLTEEELQSKRVSFYIQYCARNSILGKMIEKTSITYSWGEERKTLNESSTFWGSSVKKPTLDAHAVLFDYANNIGKRFVLSGYSVLYNYYNFGYEKSEKDMFCLQVFDKANFDAWYIYCDRERFSGLYDLIKRRGSVQIEAICEITKYQKGQNAQAEAIMAWED